MIHWALTADDTLGITGAMMLNVQALRTARGLNQRQFAELVGVRQPTISRWEAGEKEPSGLARKVLEQIAAETPSFKLNRPKVKAPSKKGARG